MTCAFKFAFNNGHSHRLRQYDVLSGELGGGAGEIPTDRPLVTLWLPHCPPTTLTLSSALNVEVRRQEPDLDLARRHRCRTITTLMILQEAEKLRQAGNYPIGDLAEFAFSEFSVWIPERALPLLLFDGGQLSASLATPHSVESARRRRHHHIHLAAQSWEHEWFSTRERQELERELLVIAKHGVDAGVRVQLQPPRWRHDVVSNTLFFSGEADGIDAVRELQRTGAEASYIWSPRPPSEIDGARIRQLTRLDSSVLRRGFETTQLDGPVWEVILTCQQ